MIFSADFETTTDPNDCRVWAIGLFEIFSKDNFIYSNNIDYLFEFLNNQKEKTVLYFHNLKFDGEFIIDYLLRNGYCHVEDKKGMTNNEFTTLISDMGAFYSITIKMEKGNTVEILNSLKILPFSVAEIARAFNLPIKKGNIDYNENREVGHVLTDNEIDYLKNDVEIVARALETIFSQNLPKMTQGSNALHDFKNIIGSKRFSKWFPQIRYDHEIRQSYKGGFTYLNPFYANKEVEEGYVLDVNSLYPSVMYYKPLPYGEGVHFEGKYKEDKLYNLYVQSFTCTFEVKENHIPTIQIKKSIFKDNEYLTSSCGNEVTLTLTSIDLELFFKHYDVYNIVWHGGWKFKSTTNIFKEYIDKWIKVKIESTENGNKSMRTLAKLMLNALYGKFALNPKVTNKYPYLCPLENRVKYKRSKTRERDSLYIPISTFITAWARNITISTSQAIKEYSLKKYDVDMYIYSDTDSIHTLLPIEECRQFMDIHPTKLGAWDNEATFKRAKFIRQKTYVEEIYNNDKTETELKITCCGMPQSCYKEVTFDNFKIGATYGGKLTPKHVKGGIVLDETEFTIRA